MIDVSYFKERFEESKIVNTDDAFGNIRQEAFDTFSATGLPTLRNEEWKYTAVGNLFNKEYQQFTKEISQHNIPDSYLYSDILPSNNQYNALVFINGLFSSELSTIRSSSLQLTVLKLEEAAKGHYKELVIKHLDQSRLYNQDGIHALNTSFINGGVYIHVHKGQELEHPVFIYHLSDSQKDHTLSQPRSLIYVEEGAKLQLIETSKTIGSMDNFSNRVMEIVVNENGIVEYYTIQNDVSNASQVNTTHIRQIGKSHVHAVTVSLGGNMIRNNINMVLEAPHNETHLYGLYFLKGNTHVDNHTLVDNRQPNCFSNQLYKGIVDDHATAVFNGKIMVQAQAQKTNAYQSNKNILLSDTASINTKPQLEILADDVKCSHGCTVGQLDENALFYLRARGISMEKAKAMLLQAFAEDILLQIKPELLREHVKGLVYKHLSTSVDK